jgi:hypothetical protein
VAQGFKVKKEKWPKGGRGLVRTDSFRFKGLPGRRFLASWDTPGKAPVPEKNQQ